MRNSENSNTKIDLFFSTPILFREDKEYAKSLLPIVENFLSDEKLTSNSYPWSHKTTYRNVKGGLKIFPEMREFEEYLCDVAKNFLSSLGYDLKKQMDAYIFASELRKGNYHNAHTHPNCIISGVFYLKIPSNSSRIIFHDPRPFRKFIMIPYKEEVDKETPGLFVPEIFIQPHEGLLLMWESWLEHEVEPNNSDDSRIALIFNIS